MNFWLLIGNLLLLLVVAGLAVVVVSLARQIGVLHERTAPLGLARKTPPIRLGDRLPPLVAPNLDGQEVDLDRVAAGGTHVALLFVATDCPICSSILPSFWRLMQAPDRSVVGYLVSDGAGAGAKGYRDYAARYGVEPRYYLLSQTLALQLHVRLLPFLVVMDSEGRLVAREVIQGPRALTRALAGLDAAPTSLSGSGTASG